MTDQPLKYASVFDVIKRAALPRDTVLDFCGERGVVVDDFGGTTVIVLADGFVQSWRWQLDGATCTVLETPSEPIYSMTSGVAKADVIPHD